ncbi:MAG: efflux RND transporter periplasmic adaptor subunit [Gemmatimonadales bacterium]
MTSPIRLSLMAAALILGSTAAGACSRDAPSPPAGSGGSASAATTEPGRVPGDSTVTLDSAAQRLADIELATVTPDTGGGLVANGTITYDGNHVSTIASRAEGRVVAVRTDLGRRVRAGEILAMVESPEVGQTEGERERAEAAVEVARRNYEREKRLYEQSISSQKEMLEAENAYRTAEADLKGTLAKLRALGAAKAEGGTFGLASPIGGVVVERHANPGQIIGPETDLFTVADLRHVWITVDLYETDYGRVQNGAAAQVMPSSLPNDTFPGKVTFAGGIVDSISRTIKVRVQVENETQRLRPGMFAQVRIATPRKASGTGTLVVPELAVQDVNGQPTVFVADSIPGRYTARAVSLGAPTAPGLVAVRDGLKRGERIAVKGAFQLKAELTKASFGEAE